ncbi:MAG: helix-turn-helix domain-containing protein [Blautia sp.]|nr:helix-turn-helix domain-containing protein [Blautia sp.]
MSTFNLLEARLKDKLIYSRASETPFFLEHVDSLDGETVVQDGTLFVAGEKETVSFIRHSATALAGRQVLFLVSAETKQQEALRGLCEQEGLSVIITEDTVPGLYLHAAKTCQYYLKIAEKVDTISQIKNMPGMLEEISGFLQENILLASADGNILYEIGDIRENTRNYIRKYFMDLMREHADFGTAGSGSGSEENLFYIRLKNHNTVIGVLLIEREKDLPNDYQKFFKKLLPYLRDYLLQELSSSQNDQMKFDRIWKDMMEGRYSSEQDIRNVFDYAGLRTRKYYRLILVQGNILAERGQGVYNEIASKLKSHLPDSMVTRYYSDIVIMNWTDDRSYEMPDDIKGLEKLLKSYGCRACVCWQSSILSWVSLLYEFSSQVLRLDQQLGGPRGKCLVEFGQYSPFLIVDMCAQYARNVKHTKNIILLTHPAVINLYRYDQEHNTNLEEVLFYYLVNHRSLGLTAQSLYMHRNTIVNKIKKIKELTPVDMDSPDVQAHLILSHYLLIYCLKVVDGNIV